MDSVFLQSVAHMSLQFAGMLGSPYHIFCAHSHARNRVLLLTLLWNIPVTTYHYIHRRFS